MADLDRVAVRVSDGLRKTLSRISTLALGIAAIAAVIGARHVRHRLWVFDGSRPTWIVVGGALCFAPTAAALLAWFYVRTHDEGRSRPARQRPHAAARVRRTPRNVLINYDTGETLANTAKIVRRPAVWT